jgi:citrate lyase subunit alpha/citrate CoA-transferase
MDDLCENSAGRLVPREVNGSPRVPFQGIGQVLPHGNKAAPPIRSCAQYPANGDKRAPDLKAALHRAGLRDGMVISSHHHFRNGDRLMAQVFDAAAELGVRELVWFPSAAFECHAPLIRHLESGVLRRVEQSLNGPLGEYASHGKMRGMAHLRSHGGRYRAIQDGDILIDIAILAAPAADAFGNASGVLGRAACGPLGFALGDSQYADHVIVVTDTLVPFPCIPWHIQGNYVDQVVVVDEVGDPSQIVSGTTTLTKSPDRLLIAEYTARFVRDTEILREGFSFQAGAGGTSLAFTVFLSEMMREANIKARFIRGGSTRVLVDLLEQGLTEAILDGQSFDLEGVRSMRDNPRHVPTSPFTSYNYHGKGNFASMLDCVVLGATEVDVNFNANVVTHSDGYLRHGIGGWQDALFSSCTILTVPTFRDRIPSIRSRVTTLCGPGELIDVVVTERGIAINPRRADLFAALEGSPLPLRSLNELKQEAEDICGVPSPAPLADKLIGVVEWVDGTLLDSIKQVAL